MISNGCEVYIDSGSPIGKYLMTELRFREYWAGKKNYAGSNSIYTLNLWRIVESEMEVYAQRVQDYLQQTFFKNKDLSPVKTSLLEALYNIKDHSNAGNEAFSFISYDKSTSVLSVAICDFGEGIAKTIRNKFSDRTSNDEEALKLAMQDNITISSTSHNRGLGMGNIMSSCTENDTLRILSNGAILSANNNEIIDNFEFNF